MNLYSIQGGSQIELEQKKYTIGIGISLGNKWFTPENIFESVKWALQYSEGKVVIYIADSIHAINLSVRNRISMEKALRITSQARTELFKKVDALIRQLPDDQQSRIAFVTWDEIVDDKFIDKLSYLRDLYEHDMAFKEVIHGIVRSHTSKEKRTFTEADIHTFGKYIIEEMPEFLNRVAMKGIQVDAYTYPYRNDVTEFAEKIHTGKIFPKIKTHIVDTQPKVFLEVR